MIAQSVPTDRKVWSTGLLHRGASQPDTGCSLGLLWAGSDLLIERGSSSLKMVKDDLALIDLRESFACQGSAGEWSARIINFCNSQIEKNIDIADHSLPILFDGRTRAVSAIRHIWLAFDDFRACGHEANECRAIDMIVTSLIAIVGPSELTRRGAYTDALLARAKALVRDELPIPN